MRWPASSPRRLISGIFHLFREMSSDSAAASVLAMMATFFPESFGRSQIELGSTTPIVMVLGSMICHVDSDLDRRVVADIELIVAVVLNAWALWRIATRVLHAAHRAARLLVS